MTTQNKPRVPIREDYCAATGCPHPVYFEKPLFERLCWWPAPFNKHFRSSLSARIFRVLEAVVKCFETGDHQFVIEAEPRRGTKMVRATCEVKVVEGALTVCLKTGA